MKTRKHEFQRRTCFRAIEPCVHHREHRGHRDWPFSVCPVASVV